MDYKLKIIHKFNWTVHADTIRHRAHRVCSRKTLPRLMAVPTGFPTHPVVRHNRNGSWICLWRADCLFTGSACPLDLLLISAVHCRVWSIWRRRKNKQIIASISVVLCSITGPSHRTSAVCGFGELEHRSQINCHINWRSNTGQIIMER